MRKIILKYERKKNEMNNFFSESDINNYVDKRNSELQQKSNTEDIANEKYKKMKNEVLDTIDVFIEACKEFPNLAKAAGIKPVRLYLSSGNSKAQKTTYQKSKFGLFAHKSENQLPEDPQTSPLYIIGDIKSMGFQYTLLAVTENYQLLKLKVERDIMGNSCEFYYSVLLFDKMDLVSDEDIRQIINNNRWQPSLGGLPVIMIYLTYSMITKNYYYDYIICTLKGKNDTTVLKSGIKRYFYILSDMYENTIDYYLKKPEQAFFKMYYKTFEDIIPFKQA